MIKRQNLIALIVFGSVTACGILSFWCLGMDRRTLVRVNPMPRISIEPAVLDLGRIERHLSVYKDGTFRIVNRGDSPLDLLGFNTSCTCTVPDLRPQVLPPGSSIAVSLRVKSRGESGSFNTRVTLISNDPSAPSRDLEVKWTEINPLLLEPRAIDFGPVLPSVKTEAVVSVSAAKHIDVGKLILSPPDSCLSFAWDGRGSRPLNVSSPRTVELHVLLNSGEDVGPQSREILVTSVDGRFSARLPVRWKTVLPIELVPSAIFQSGVPKKSRVKHQIMIKWYSGQAVDLSSLTIDGRALAFSSARIDDGRLSYLTTSFTVETGDSSGVQRHSIEMTLRDAKKTRLALPVAYLVD